MKTLDDLTPEIIAKIPQYKERCTKDLYSGVEFASFNKQESTEYVEKIYELAGYKKPVVIFAIDIPEYRKKFASLQDESVLEIVTALYELKNKEGGYSMEEYDKLEKELFTKMENTAGPDVKAKSNYLFLCSAYHRVYLTWYKFIQDEFNIDHKNKDILNYLYEHANNNISNCYFTEGYVLVLRMPQRIIRNETGFHSTTEAAIQWPGYKMYYINGRRVPDDLFNKTLNKTLTFDEFMEIKDEDVKACLVTMMKENDGNDALMKFLDAEVVDEVTINHTSGHTEVARLWKTSRSYDFLSDMNGNMGQPYAWLELTCPSSGSVYMLDTSAHFTSALDACKYHRPQTVPADMEYDFKEFNN